MKGLRGTLACIAVAALAVAGSAGSKPTRTNAALVWYWSEQFTADAVYKNGIGWPSIKRHDAVRGDTCWGVGHPVVNSTGLRHFRYFWCEARLRNGTRYNLIVNVLQQARYGVAFGGYTKAAPEWWTEQYVADALVKNGIQWSNAFDPVSGDYCDGFGRSFSRNGAVYFKDFFCAVNSSARSSYFVVVDVDGLKRYSVYWVDFNAAPQAAPPAPVSASTQTPSPDGAHTVTIGSSYDPSAGTTVTVPGGAPSSGDQGHTITIGGYQGPVLDAVTKLCASQSNAAACTQVGGLVNSVTAARAATIHVITRSPSCIDPDYASWHAC